MHGHHMHGQMHGDGNNPCAMQDHAGMDSQEHMHGDGKNPCAMHDHEGMQAHEHMQGHHHGHEMGAMKGAFMETKEVDGYTVTFHVMKAPKGMDKGGTHHLMVKVEKAGKIVPDLIANSKAKHPNGKSESKMLMKMGDWYMAAYDLGHAGRHELMVLFKTPDGAKHFTGVYYPAEKAE
ncbi:MAG: hypothetical protein D6751_03670 [Deltaproteobacteria bacterium]|nr:MAG: hypothetical protein D6751_03670 [Deltaproteobacteria bacterium]